MLLFPGLRILAPPLCHLPSEVLEWGVDDMEAPIIPGPRNVHPNPPPACNLPI